ncbi:putative heterokaryon incompatibility protein [Rosellinia necatrix]|uniref:Putative heterokaryon incompatibility protein n=1 Tax=Rosellinia necatrix TaxID=77044 RepID=A0A1W2TP19_ROSNE|nr:putative heterokaryon incompatibility protein [Rosellinia necatrix]
MERYSPGKTEERTSCSLSWEVDDRIAGSNAGTNPVKSTRRVHLSWTETTTNVQEVYLVFVAPPDSRRLNSDAMSKWERGTHFLDREITDRENQALITSWLNLCLTEHRDACWECHGTEADFKALVEETYFGVVDVVDMQLQGLPIKDGKPVPFIALSYVWGSRILDGVDYVTTRANVATYIRHGGLKMVRDRLPPTIQDAILLVRRLGHRYLWIDALCIVQDSNSSWQLNARAMHMVYGNALFTICAGDGNASTVFFAAGTGLQAHRIFSADQHNRERDLRPISAECAPGVRLMVTRPLEAVVNDSEWNTHAWTFQARVLSRRCLIFAEGRVYFQCRTMGISQDVYTDGVSSGWSLGRIDSPLRTLEELQQRPLWFYMKYISMYTGRKLAKPGDVLAAFEGISWLLERCMKAPLLFGLPTSHFDLALLWSPVKAINMRRPKNTSLGKRTCTKNEQGNCMCNVEHDSFLGKQFPTWSWSGWMDGRIEYPLSTLDGCLVDVREWLKRRTWIQWYIRNEKGHLRPLWRMLPHQEGQDPFSEPRQRPEEDGWSGYGGRVQKSRTAEREAMHVRGAADQPIRDDNQGRDRRDRGNRVTLGPGAYYNQGITRHRVVYSRSPSRSAGVSSSDSSESEKDHKRVGNEGYVLYRLQYISRPTEPPPMPASSGGPAYDDNYGRVIDGGIPRADDDMFQLTLPDNPFGVIRDTSLGPTDSDEHYMPVLQFWTWSTTLHVSVRDVSAPTNEGDLSKSGFQKPTVTRQADTGLCQCDIADKAGDWCGCIILADDWIRPRDGGSFQFIAISEAKAFTEEECPVWTYYIPKERSELEWDLYYVLLIERSQERGLWERVGLGKVFKTAFAGKSWSEIELG